MRKINPHDFKVARRGTSREINRQIALNLIRAHQPVSRADLARLMNVRRGVASLLVSELLDEGLIFEGAVGEAVGRGRRPTFLYIDSRQRCVVGVDIRASRTYIMITDLMGHQLGVVSSFQTNKDVETLIQDLTRRIKQVLGDYKEVGACEGVGVVVPGMVDLAAGRVLHAPTLSWRDVNLREPLAAAVGIPVHIENSGKACALAQLWATRSDGLTAGNSVFVSVSDGVGTGIVMNGELLRGRHNTAGEFGHVPLSIDGPRCSCGATGCWEAYVSNLATLSRYFGRDLSEPGPRDIESSTFTVEDLIARARAGDAKALAAINSTARYLGLGLASIINAIDPARIYIGGEITTAWSLIEPIVRSALRERTLTDFGGVTEIQVVPAEEHPRLRGAVALVAAPAFAAPMVA
ncbi:MAG TPA: ROK family protein [Pyrinomonadaceae bacterium]|jgi:predicted NBD/HSP70 family sugar kinase|nr:ROK family protein [Pyrinomonadaceae bacterium]